MDIDINNVPKHIFTVFLILLIMTLMIRPRLSRGSATLLKPEPIRTDAVMPVPVTMATVEIPQPVFRPLLLDIKPSPMRAFDFSIGKTEGRLVMYGEKPTKRFMLLWKLDEVKAKAKFVRLQPIQISDLSQAISTSLDEAKEITHKMFGKKQRQPKNKEKSTVPVVAAVPQAVVLPMPVVKSAEAITQPVIVEKPVLKGFKQDWTGVLMAEGPMEHSTTKCGEVETYKAYTVKMNVNDEEVSVQGQDMKRALSEVGAKVGNKIHLIHVRTEPLEGGRSRKVFACSVLQ